MRRGIRRRLGAGAVRKGRARGSGWEDGEIEASAPTMPLLFIEGIFFFFRVEVSGVAPAMHHRRAEEVRGRESAVVRGTSGHGCN